MNSEQQLATGNVDVAKVARFPVPGTGRMGGSVLTEITPLVRPPVRSAPPHVGLLIVFGPEARAFLHSGLAERLARWSRISVITALPSSAVFAGLQGIGIYEAPAATEPAGVAKLRHWSKRLHELWMERQGRVRWRHSCLGSDTKPVPGDSEALPDWGVCPAWLRIANLAERSLAGAAGGSRRYRELFAKLQLDCLLAADYASPLTVAALQSAAACGVASVVLANSWKDVYANPYVPVAPDLIGVVGAREADLLRSANPHLSADRLAVVPSLHLQRFYRPGPAMSRQAFCRQFGLAPERPYLCYTAASPHAVPGEERIVEALLNAVSQHPARPQVLLRLNPREDGERFRPLLSQYRDLVIERPRWEWDRARDWNAPLPQDLDDWVATVQHSAFNVSVPSTVSLEFTALGRRVLNVCFDADPVPRGASNLRFWNAPFYHEIRQSPLVSAAFSEQEFRERLADLLRDLASRSQSPPGGARQPVEVAEALIRGVLDSKRRSPQLFPKPITIRPFDRRTRHQPRP